MSKRANEWDQRSARAKWAVRSKRTSDRCEQTSGRPSGPLLTSPSQGALNQCVLNTVFIKYLCNTLAMCVQHCNEMCRGSPYGWYVLWMSSWNFTDINCDINCDLPHLDLYKKNTYPQKLYHKGYRFTLVLSSANVCIKVLLLVQWTLKYWMRGPSKIDKKVLKVLKSRNQKNG